MVTRSTLWAVRVCTNPALCRSALLGCFSPGPRKNDLTIHWALGPFVRSFTLLVDPGDIYPPQAPDLWVNLEVIILKILGPTCRFCLQEMLLGQSGENDFLLSSSALLHSKSIVLPHTCALEVGFSFCKTLNFIRCTRGAPNGCSPRASSRF